jgi:polysaccharide export outer membrane protein
VREFRVFASLIVLGIALGGCAIVPTSGPQSIDVRHGQRDPESLPYGFVRVTPAVLDILARSAPRLSTAFKDRRGPEELRFGIGDIVNVTVFEAGAGGLFIPSEAGVRPGNFITLPPQSVDSRGYIFVPYAGAIRANGRTTAEIQNAIVAALKDRALEPQAIVSWADQRASSISVLGEAVGSIRFPASASGERVLDAITRAGLRAPGHDLWVMLERRGRRETVPFGALIYESANNIYVRPQDTIFIYRDPQTFLAFGATSGAAGANGGIGATLGGSTTSVSSRQYNFDAWRISLAEATAKAGGLNDMQADPGSVFLYRGETREVAQALGVDCTPFSGPIIPIIYNVNLRDPAGYFLATKFEMRNKDVIYVSNAVAVDTSKFLTYLRLIIATAQDPINFATAAYVLKNTINGTSNAAVIVGGTQ